MSDFATDMDFLTASPPTVLAGGIRTVPPRDSTEQWLVSVLKSPKTLSQLRAIHAQVIKTGHSHNDLVLGRLLLCCSTSRSMGYALSIFQSIPSPEPFFYNAMLKGYAQNGAHGECLGLYSLMRAGSVPCDSFTFPAVLRSAASLGLITSGEEVHGVAVKMGFAQEVIVQTAVMDMYSSCGLANRARVIFDRMDVRDAICWNSMIAGHVKCGEYERACELFDRMPEKNISSWNTVLNMYCKIGNMHAARHIFDNMPERDVISWNAMISGHATAGDSDAAWELFKLMPKRNAVSWNAMISCYVHCTLFHEALSLFREMQASGIKPNEVTVVAVLVACSHLGALELGRWVEAYILRQCIKVDAYVTSALIDMYGKCGSLVDAQRVFDGACGKNTVLCSAMIEVLAMHGKAEEAFMLFDFMSKEAIMPNDVTFVGLLKACSHAGLVEAGRNYFNMMSGAFEMTPKIEHYGCMVDLLGRAGHLEEAYKLILAMPMDPHSVVWSSLLSSSRIHGDVKLAERVASHVLELDPGNCGNYVLLSNTYSKADRWGDAAMVRKTMKEKGIAKRPGCSLIEVRNVVHEFLAGDCDHPQRKDIYGMLDHVVMRLKREGYTPSTSYALQDVDSDRQEQTVLHHSEKLALAFGLLSTERDTAVRIVKNLRICEDCHVFMKLMSKHYGRQIIVRDCNRFHHFRDGSCSCLDYW